MWLCRGLWWHAPVRPAVCCHVCGAVAELVVRPTMASARAVESDVSAVVMMWRAHVMASAAAAAPVLAMACSAMVRMMDLVPGGPTECGLPLARVAKALW